MANGLPERTIYSIYHRLRKLLAPLKRGLLVTDRQIAGILDLHRDCGNKWTTISKELGGKVDPKTINEIIRHRVDYKTGQKFDTGRWSMEEDEKLLEVIREVTGEEDLSNRLINIPWKRVSEKLVGRSERQCRKHWQYSLSWKQYNPEVDSRRKWTLTESARLIYCIYRQPGCYNEADIDWDLLKEKFS